MAFVTRFEDLRTKLHQMECEGPEMEWVGNGIPIDYIQKGKSKPCIPI